MGATKSPSLYRRLLRWFFLLVGGYLFLCLAVAFLQRRMQYLPDTGEVRLPRGPQYGDLEDVTLRTKDGLRVRAWYWPGSRPVTLVIFHGNAGNRGGGRLSWIESFHRRGLGVFLLDYRGYGGSEGSPTEDGLYLDAEAALDWLDERKAPNPVLFGESLGCGVAVEMAVRRRPRALIIQSGFSSAVDVGRHHYPFLPVNLLMKDRFENDAKIGRIQCPSLFIHGKGDRIVPLAFGRRLYEQAPEPRELHLMRFGHNDLVFYGGQEYFDKVDDFLRRRVEKGG